MKLGKDELQKIFLGVLVLFGVLYYYFVMLLGPLNLKELKAHNTLNDLGPKIAAANEAIKAVKPLKTKAEEAETTLDQVKSLIPDGSPVAWFPPSMIEFFKRQGIEKCNIHRADEGVDPALPGFRRMNWAIDIPRVEVVQLALAVAALENEHPLMEITTLHIDASKDLVQYQSVRMTLSTVTK